MTRVPNATIAQNVAAAFGAAVICRFITYRQHCMQVHRAKPWHIFERRAACRH